MTAYRTFRESAHSNVFTIACIAARLGVSVEAFTTAALDWNSQRFVAHVRDRMKKLNITSLRSFSRETGAHTPTIRRMLDGTLEYTQLRSYRYIARALKVSLDDLLSEFFNEEQLKQWEQIGKINPMLELSKSEHKKIQISA